MIALLRPNSWDFPLFLHVLGAVLLVGGVGSVVLVSVAGLRNAEQAALMRKLAFWTTLVLVWPAYVLMRGGAQWIYSREDLHPDFPTWIAVGVTVGDGGVVVLLVLTLLGWLGLRRARIGPWFAGLAALYLVALGVAWWAMSAKPGA